MIDLYTWPTPNGFKVSILLEELGLSSMLAQRQYRGSSMPLWASLCTRTHDHRGNTEGTVQRSWQRSWQTSW